MLLQSHQYPQRITKRPSIAERRRDQTDKFELRKRLQTRMPRQKRQQIGS